MAEMQSGDTELMQCSTLFLYALLIKYIYMYKILTTITNFLYSIGYNE